MGDDKLQKIYQTALKDYELSPPISQRQITTILDKLETINKKLDDLTSLVEYLDHSIINEEAAL